MTYEKVTNEQLINLCDASLERVKESEKRHYFYNQQDWQDLEDATNELQKRAGMNEDLDCCDSNDFDRIIEKAISAIQSKYHPLIS